MLVVNVIGLIISSIILIVVSSFVLIVILGIKRDNSKDKAIKHLQNDLNSIKLRYDMLNEMYLEYKAKNQIKAKYRVNEKIYVVDGKKPYAGVIVEIHQGQAHEITYTVQYAEWKSTTLNKSIVRQQNKVYKTLADAIDGEKLM